MQFLQMGQYKVKFWRNLFLPMNLLHTDHFLLLINRIYLFKLFLVTLLDYSSIKYLL